MESSTVHPTHKGLPCLPGPGSGREWAVEDRTGANSASDRRVGPCRIGVACVRNPIRNPILGDARRHEVLWRIGKPSAVRPDLVVALRLAGASEYSFHDVVDADRTAHRGSVRGVAGLRFAGRSSALILQQQTGCPCPVVGPRYGFAMTGVVIGRPPSAGIRESGEWAWRFGERAVERDRERAPKAQVRS